MSSQVLEYSFTRFLEQLFYSEKQYHFPKLRKCLCDRNWRQKDLQINLTVDDVTKICLVHVNVPVYQLDILKPRSFDTEAGLRERVEQQKQQLYEQSTKLISCSKLAFSILRGELA